MTVTLVSNFLLSAVSEPVTEMEVLIVTFESPSLMSTIINSFMREIQWLAIMENWNQDQPKNNSNSCGLYIIGHGHRKSTSHPYGWYNTICGLTFRLLNGVLVKVAINNYYYKQRIAVFVILLTRNTFPMVLFTLGLVNKCSHINAHRINKHLG